MTIFDTINHPLTEDNRAEVWTTLPQEIKDYWIRFHHTEPHLIPKRIKLLQTIIYEYNTDICRVRKYHDNI
jgi:uncharacterized protein (DUF2267 family)